MKKQLVVLVVSAVLAGCGGGGGEQQNGVACQRGGEPHCTTVWGMPASQIPDFCRTSGTEPDPADTVVAACPDSGVRAKCAGTREGMTYEARYYDDFEGAPVSYMEDRRDCAEDGGVWVETRPIAQSCDSALACVDVYSGSCEGETVRSSPCPIHDTLEGMCVFDDSVEVTARLWVYAGNVYGQAECESDGGVWSDWSAPD